VMLPWVLTSLAQGCRQVAVLNPCVWTLEVRIIALTTGRLALGISRKPSESHTEERLYLARHCS